MNTKATTATKGPKFYTVTYADNGLVVKGMRLNPIQVNAMRKMDGIVSVELIPAD